MIGSPSRETWEFYGRSGICLPLPITRQQYQGQKYAFGVFVVLNFVLFLLIGAVREGFFWESGGVPVGQSRCRGSSPVRLRWDTAIRDFSHQGQAEEEEEEDDEEEKELEVEEEHEDKKKKEKKKEEEEEEEKKKKTEGYQLRLSWTELWEFYGRSGICLPLPITRQQYQGQKYAFGVFVVLNFVLFLLIGAGQLIPGQVVVRVFTSSVAAFD
nr:hypothetical protein BaRGS_029313 [Batillaria attramentaria]